ncbi:ABC transporter substrate-binding protein [Gordonia McavH-238-E]|uniref:ABC transporter substrate-binding protein n=1 Tax=Gordonia sp. McavH-238-E TaxID=2917736 RepID=UPI001EF4BEFC|nr:ABC transporter substrate-binding protein [Gordonia sp. McavH-238-E]MCG7631215.1 ABC transporter substrate-binding protein [Gordonia sp. McavH-238-E]
MRFSATRFAVTIAAATLVLAGCTGSGGNTDEAAGGDPISLENCGRTVSVESTPQRVVSLNQASTEILLSLGLGDRMVGTATWTDPVRQNLAEANSSIPRLADNKPSLETVLAANPDFVTASFGSSIGDGGAEGRDQYEKLGVPTYLSPTDNGCNGEVSSASNADGARTTPYTMDSVYQEIRELAAIFGVEERGDEFITELKDRVRAASESVNATGVSLAYWFADTRTPYMAGCCGSSGAITAAVGATNVFADTTDEWPQVPWETVADRNPTVLVMADLSRRSVDGDALDSKIAFLESNPVTAQMQAVRDRRYIIVNGADMNPTIRTVDGIEKVAAALQKWNLATPQS